MAPKREFLENFFGHKINSDDSHDADLNYWKIPFFSSLWRCHGF